MERQKKILINEIKNAQGTLGELRVQEKELAIKEKEIYSLPAISGDDLRDQLKRILPSRMLPSNIGRVEEVSWPYWYELEFDYSNGADAFFGANDIKRDFFQVGQEAGFLLTHVYRDYNSSTAGGLGAPLVMDFQNLQSSRNFNDQPIQVQHIGNKGHPFKFETPILLYPNSKLEVTLQSWLSVDATVPSVSGKQRFIFLGRRVKTKEILTMKADLYSDSL